MVQLLVAKDLKSSPTGFTGSPSNTYLFMFPFNDVNMCIMFHSYHGLQNFFVHHEKPPTRSRRQQCTCLHTNLLKKNTYREKFITPMHGQSLHHHVMDLSVFNTVGTNGPKYHDLQLKLIQRFKIKCRSFQELSKAQNGLRQKLSGKWVQTPTDILPKRLVGTSVLCIILIMLSTSDPMIMV